MLCLAFVALFQALDQDDISPVVLAGQGFDDPATPGSLWMGGVVGGEQTIDNYGVYGELLKANGRLHVYTRSIAAVHALVPPGF
jgi:hypothetical protein